MALALNITSLIFGIGGAIFGTWQLARARRLPQAPPSVIQWPATEPVSTPMVPLSALEAILQTNAQTQERLIAGLAMAFSAPQMIDDARSPSPIAPVGGRNYAEVDGSDLTDLWLPKPEGWVPPFAPSDDPNDEFGIGGPIATPPVGAP